MSRSSFSTKTLSIPSNLVLEYLYVVSCNAILIEKEHVIVIAWVKSKRHKRLYMAGKLNLLLQTPWVTTYIIIIKLPNSEQDAALVGGHAIQPQPAPAGPRLICLEFRLVGPRFTGGSIMWHRFGISSTHVKGFNSHKPIFSVKPIQHPVTSHDSKSFQEYGKFTQRMRSGHDWYCPFAGFRGDDLHAEFGCITRMSKAGVDKDNLEPKLLPA